MFKQVPEVLRYQVPSYPGIQTGTPGPRYLGTPSYPTTRQVPLVLRYQIPKYPGTQTGTQALLPFIDSDIIHGMCILMIHYIYRWTIGLFKFILRPRSTMLSVNDTSWHIGQWHSSATLDVRPLNVFLFSSSHDQEWRVDWNLDARITMTIINWTTNYGKFFFPLYFGHQIHNWVKICMTRVHKKNS